jgi:hypothetical protein
MEVKVKVQLTVSGVSFSSLSANTTLLADFTNNMQSAVAEAAGVNASQVNITLKSGSVIVMAEITPTAGTSAATLEAAVKQPAALTALTTKVLAKAKATSGIAAVVEAGGSISVSAPTVTNTAPTAAPTAAPTVAAASPTAAPTTAANGSTNTNATTTAVSLGDGSAADGAVRLAALDFATMLACVGMSVVVLSSM